MKFSLVTLFVLGLSLAGCSAATGDEDTPYVSEENAAAPAEGKADEVKKPDPTAVPPPKGKVPDSVVRLTNGEFLTGFALLMDKSSRTLSVWKNQDGSVQLVASYPADLGKNAGDKRTLGDQRTPEGIYFFNQMLEGARLNFDEYGVRAFTTDYPNFFDLQAGKTGNGIWLHGIPETKSLARGSRGCVVVRNEVLKEISSYIQLEKTPLIIADKVQFIDESAYRKTQREFLDWLETWRKAWESKQIESYISHYAPRFKALGMNLAQWKSYKSGLNEKYKHISVRTLEPVVLTYRDQAIVRFLQAYNSDLNSDFGQKTLHLIRSGGKIQILSETWSALDQDLLARVEKSTTVAR